ncbi:bifunctional 4-hydroxy-2-oxoglutarate aldolase/2-dehydro-3-deoxy-phosphogluconate aldolase [Sulfurovum sp. XGS-02]|uniref:bifunctional 4-hydroxy-2-oxoglutarate aldolase/2-dehydro-3-deoxy-phosphogluconate aldolase n=1 Tax=Sulfurovum sp. XGS-02 TaxID=2925411 RepID=UPI002056B699|nr:bifunctional 4-hydroxy-2-oxoglutarate aldolase/2-dehydro-3-deoxy-phosphogluconate aldolase [Sulfurovum sp. XGS-02]UPT76639.1 bifunctional 4-hydroxy-2-oxoglutarate aldolase/2-dehydro-3-deoxy-phosphogluconate aldolase [Sulfurovum sp. XGS-02]
MTAKEVMQISPIVPVIALEHIEDALPLAEALLEGGISIMEITLRTDAGLGSIEAISKALPQMHVGAGTVLNSREFENAVAHGAEFVFSPGISEDLMQTSKALNVALIPGVATASEVMLAKNNGFEHCKLFPATLAGGVEILKAFSGPFSSMRFCPTGGVNLENINDFLALENVLCAGGSWIVPKQAVKEKNFKQITQLCREAIQVIKGEK